MQFLSAQEESSSFPRQKRKPGSEAAFTYNEVVAIRQYWQAMIEKYGVDGVQLGYLLRRDKLPNQTTFARARNTSPRAVSEMINGITYPMGEEEANPTREKRRRRQPEAE